MNKENTTTHHDVAKLVDDAEALLAATTDVAEEKVVQARKRLAGALDKGRETWATVKEKACEGAKATDQAIRKHPYEAMGVAFGVGALIGFLLSRRN
jgi:ElaB/YqjD/DUF883 family membrane-anchored ribosome-binding protein